ncbi:XdhC family protein [Streptomyces sp. MBT56]|uniref:XdhC family protein n=1 Tax=unclassified Streptomyces TaxID=2593676 RepID=UPI00190B9C1B|nr:MULTISPECIES: XdhC family protein [unclassified Streptomyces]MBK3559399.1 XdhC family protein [Streptomyces sp. MBT56]MBK3605703.1 XdhC family protein [Streptomyces sp. MBT54]MBK3618559.1 XdhC family protein [Streptomyces sp. MBT98]MBK6045240.1 XdhC family protein [Streptomyces sp. MBT55]
MRDILPDLRARCADGVPLALATVVAVHGSAPRDPGAVMAVDAAGTVVGSVSGGCVEGDVYEVAREVLAGAGPRVVSYGISDDEAFGVGLTCGGTIEVLVRAYATAAERADLAAVLGLIAADRPVAEATVLSGAAETGARLVVRPSDAGAATGTLGSEGLDAAVTADARGLLAQGHTAIQWYGSHGQRRMQEVAVFIRTYAPPPRMLVFGAIDHAAATARIGSFLGYRVTVCDARPAFATRERFPTADEVVRAWPHTYLESTEVDARTVICVLTHDPKFDVPLLLAALRTPAAYIGVMGSRRTHHDRLTRLREAGADEAALSRLASPVGLDLGARTPEETAVSIAAEVIQHRWGGTGRPLGELTGAIHHPGGQTGTR